MMKFSLIELPDNKLLYDVQGESDEIVTCICQAMTDKPELMILILSAVGIWGSQDARNKDMIHALMEQIEHGFPDKRVK